MDGNLAALAPELARHTKAHKTRRHRRAYFRLEYKNRYPDPAKYF